MFTLRAAGFRRPPARKMASEEAVPEEEAPGSLVEDSPPAIAPQA